MKVIERSPISGDGGPNSIVNRVKGIWRFGLSWDRDVQAQSVLIQNLESILDNTYTMVRNVPLPGFSLPVPLVLISQTGVRTFYASAVRGIFRVKGDNWYKLAEKDGRYKLDRPNLVRRTELMSRAVIDYLGKNNIYLDESEPVLYFAQPGVHVDAPESPVRLLQIDGVNRYAASLLDENTVLNAMEIHHIIEVLSRSKSIQRSSSKSSLNLPSDMVGYGDFQLKIWQWILLFFLAIFMLITVIITAVIIVGST
ncbi:MAG: hypothetical protein ACWGN2_08430 [Anaerolineales bacterium]